MSRVAAALASFFLFTSFAAAQSHPPTLRVEVNLQPIDVQVKDANGNDIPGLSANDFTVLENSHPQKIAFFDPGSGPVTLAILVDSSSSMNANGRLGSASTIAAQFMRTARPGDEIWGMDFSDQMGPFQQLTTEQLANPAAIKLAPAPSHGSALYDAIAAALCHLQTSKNPRQGIIVISDGVDEYSRISLDELIGLIRSSRAQLFMIGLQSLPQFGFSGHAEPQLTLITGHDIDNPVVVFQRLMTESGTESFIPKSQSALDEALKAVSNLLQSEYTLAYYPHDTANKLRKIEVKVNRHGAHVLARHFVDSQQDALQFVHFDEATCTVSPKSHPYPYEFKLTRGPGGIIYRDDFSDRRTGWPNHPDSHYVSGGYELSNLPVQASNVTAGMRAGGGDASALALTALAPQMLLRNVVAAYGPWWINFVASATMELKATPGDTSAYSGPAGMVFRMNTNGYYALLLSSTIDTRNKKKTPAQIVRLIRRDLEADSYTDTTLVPATTIDATSISTASISVEAVGSQISISVDGQKIQTVQDGIYKQGLVGFIISGPGQAVFKNLIVQESSAPPVPLPAPSGNDLSHQ